MIVTSQAGLALESDSAPELPEAVECAEAQCPVAMSEELYEKSAEAFRTIGEAAGELGLKTHVLRFWETKFDNLRPMKRPDGRRYYRPEDMELLRRLQNLLHVQGMTIRGAVKIIEDGSETAQAGEDEAEALAAPAAETGASVRDLQDAVREAVQRGDFRVAEVSESSPARARLEGLLADLTTLKQRLDTVRTAA